MMGGGPRAAKEGVGRLARMKLRPLPSAVALAAFLAAAVTVCAADDAARVLRLAGASLDSGGPVSLDAAKTAAALVVKRCAHAGIEGVTSADSADGKSVEIRIAPGTDAREADVRRFFRRGFVEFRIRAATSVEDEWRDRRLQAGAEPPPQYAWRVPEQGSLQFLVETPERAAAAKVAALVKKGAAQDSAEMTTALADVETARRDSVFTNERIGAASVSRSMSTIGAQFLRHVSVRFEFKEDSRAAFEKFTGASVGRGLCVVVDGKVQVCATIQAAMPGNGELRTAGSGYTEGEAQEMAAILESGPLPCQLVPAKDK
jgi:hypothetical protein